MWGMLSRRTRRLPTDEHRLARRRWGCTCERSTGAVASALYGNLAVLDWMRQCQLLAGSGHRAQPRRTPGVSPTADPPAQYASKDHQPAPGCVRHDRSPISNGAATFTPTTWRAASCIALLDPLEGEGPRSAGKALCECRSLIEGTLPTQSRAQRSELFLSDSVVGSNRGDCG